MTRYIPLFILVLIAGIAGEVCAAEHAAHEEISLNPFASAWGANTALWTLAIFLTVFGILYKLAFAPIAKALDDREQGILDNIASAKKQNEEAKALLKQYQEKLDGSKEEVRQIMEQARQNAQRQAEVIVASARDAAGLERDRAMKEIEGATAAALQSIAERSAALATNLAGKMIRAEVKPEQHRSLIDAALKEFTRG